jgi:uncharacterized SAM-binding protein YcdF (DUF218 family)
MRHLLKAVAAVLASPLLLALLVTLAAVGLRLAGRIRVSRLLLIGAACLAYLASIPLVGQALLRPLETRYPPIAGDPPVVGYVVVLGSGYAPHDGVPVTAALDEDGLVRGVEAVRLARALPGSRLLVSGGGASGADERPTAQGYARLARAMGIAQEAIILSDRPLDTEAEAREVRQLLGSSPFLLVTSAYHMPRAMLLMRQAGAHPIAAPTGQHAYGRVRIEWRAFLPGASGLHDTERALHEYLGLAAIAIGLD